MLEIFAYHTVVHFTDQNWISKTVYRIGFTNWNTKITLLRASMVVTYYIKLFRTGADRHNSILMSLLLLVAETIKRSISRLCLSLSHLFKFCLNCMDSLNLIRDCDKDTKSTKYHFSCLKFTKERNSVL